MAKITHRSRMIASCTVFAAAVALGRPAIVNAQTCQPGIDAAWETHRPNYDLLWVHLVPQVENLTAILNTVTNQETYANLLGAARVIAANTPNGRLVITATDGTVIVDTSRPDGESPATANSYAHFIAKTINENLNTRVAMMAAQTFPCGIAIETKVSTTTGNVESQFAVRLGQHLNNSGTARLSVSGAPGPWDY